MHNGPAAKTSHETALAPITVWLSEEARQSLYTSEYWNNIAEEQNKEWWIAQGGEAEFRRLRSYLERSGLMDQYRIAEQSIEQMPDQALAVADLAAGIGWTSVLLSKLPKVDTVHAVDISQHRIELLFPQAIRMFGGNAAKLKRYAGSFYELGFDDRSMDVVLLSQAFHHAASPLRLLTEVDRVLKPGGRLILIGENFTGSISTVERVVKMLVTQRRLCFNFFELFPPDHQLGDHYYRLSDYYLFCQLLGFDVVLARIHNRQSLVVIAEKSG